MYKEQCNPRQAEPHGRETIKADTPTAKQKHRFKI